MVSRNFFHPFSCQPYTRVFSALVWAVHLMYRRLCMCNKALLNDKEWKIFLPYKLFYHWFLPSNYGNFPQREKLCYMYNFLVAHPFCSFIPCLHILFLHYSSTTYIAPLHWCSLPDTISINLTMVQARVYNGAVLFFGSCCPLGDHSLFNWTVHLEPKLINDFRAGCS